MKVPLVMHVNDDGISICHDGIFEHTKFPIKPFILAEKTSFPTLQGIKTETWTKMPGNIPTEYLNIEFESIKELNDFRTHNIDKASKLYYNAFNEQIYISIQDWVLNYPHRGPLKVLFWDIEVKTTGDGIFPRASTSPILCIGYSIWNYHPDGRKERIKIDIVTGFNDEVEDIDIITNFVTEINTLNPDIIAGYNSERFDFPYLYERAKIKEVPLTIGRNGKEPFITARGDIHINGRIHYDIYRKVEKDQTLFGIKSRTLKVMGRYYNCPLTEEEDIELLDDIRNTYNLFNTNKRKLYAYQLADVVRTEHVGAIYIRNDITLAERVKVPLNNTMNTYSSFIPKLFVGRNEWDRKLISTETNFNKYNTENGSIAKVGSKYEGALVGLYKTGYFPKTYKLDFKSMYPSAACTFNLGPDTTELISVKEYTGKYKFFRDDKYNWYRIPDKNFNIDMIIRVKNDVEGFLKKEIKMLWDERAIIKKELKAAKDKNDTELVAGLDSQQYAVKVILNSIYGMMGLKSTTYGDMMSAVMITGMCRWTTTKTIMKYADKLIELDSVTGDTPIYIKYNATDEVSIIPIEDLHTSCDERQSQRGLSFKVLTRNGWKAITYTKKHKVKKNIHRVKISDGYVDVTEDHSLFDVDRNEISPKNIQAKVTRIETTKRPFGNEGIRREKNFCWLIGFLIAEGSVYEGYTKTGIEKRQVSFNGNDLELMKKVETLANKYFNIPCFGNSKFKLYNTLESSAVYKVQGGYNKSICSWLKSNCYTKNKVTKKVPVWILNGSSESKEAFLDGLMTGDGYNTISKENRTIESLDSKFKTLSAGIRFLWQSLGEDTICSIRNDKLNITTYRKRVKYKNGTLKNIDKRLVSKNKIISNTEQYVYDISTTDGTFVTALGDIVLHNTDGLALDDKVSEEDTNNWLNEIILQNFGIEDNYMQMELDEYEDAYFYAMKNYIVREGNEFIIHGSSMKSSRACGVVDRATQIAIQHVFNSKPVEEVLSEAYDFSTCTIEDFTYRMRLSKDKTSYDDKTGQAMFLAAQVELATHQEIGEGLQMEYVITKGQRTEPELQHFYNRKTQGRNYTYVGLVNNVNEIDLSYYQEAIDKVLARFRIFRVVQENLFGEDFATNTGLNVVPTEI